MSFVIPSWVKIALLIAGIIVFIAMAVFLYLIIAGADQSRRPKTIMMKTRIY